MGGQEGREVGALGGVALDAAKPDLPPEVGRQIAKVERCRPLGVAARGRVGLPPAVVVLGDRSQQELSPRMLEEFREAKQAQEVGGQARVVRLRHESAACWRRGHDHSRYLPQRPTLPRRGVQSAHSRLPRPEGCCTGR